MTSVRAALVAAYPAGGRPLLIGADTGVGPRHTVDPATASTDDGTAKHLEWIATFYAKCSPVIDALSWHTYDFRSEFVGTADHQPLPFPPPANASRLWDPAYLAVAGILADNVSAIVRRAGGKAPIWLSETNSVCHQGIANDTNAFANSLWLTNRLGMMAARGVQVMARQSLIGCAT